LLGVAESLKGITSDQITSEFVLQLYTSGNLQLVNKINIQQFSQFNAHFLTNVDEEQACNFAAYAPSDETTPLQVQPQNYSKFVILNLYIINVLLLDFPNLYYNFLVSVGRVDKVLGDICKLRIQD
jgi:hypothetical protein